MRSLRSRVGAMMALGAFVLTGVAGVVIASERWREERSRLPAEIELEVFRLSEFSGLSLGEVPGDDAFALRLDDAALDVDSSGSVDAELREWLIDRIWSQTTEQDLLLAVSDEFDGRIFRAAGVQCVDLARCDTVIVGAFERPFAGYLAPRLGWIVGAALVVAGLVFVAARWTVARSLRPVEAMRSELAAITTSDLTARISAPPTGDELERLGRTLDETIGRLSTAVVANERFVADAAHELRSPLTGVRAALELEHDRNPSDLLRDSISEVDRASRLVEDLLVLARQQAGAAHRRVDVDLDDLVSRVVSATAVSSPEVSIDRRLEPARVIGDPDALTRAVTNLVDNAVRHGGSRVAVTIESTGDRALLHVDDDGTGVPATDRARVFERFARLDESRSRGTGGSGLGLAIVAELVADHGGSVTITESPLGGARFTVALPAS